MRTQKMAVMDIFHKLGIPAHLDGYRYLRDAVLMALSDDSRKLSLTKTIYPEIAGKYGTSACRVERSMRNAIETGWSRGNAEEINKLFGYTVSPERGKPTNTEFIATIADTLRLEKI